MSFEIYRDRLDATPFAVLGTAGDGGRLDLVPCCFAVDDRTGSRPELVTAIDHKPKSTSRLARLANIERDPTVTLLVDHRDPHDWSTLWWIRMQGRGRVVEDGAAHRSAIDALVAKYPQYVDWPPAGPAIRIAVERWAGWGP